MAKWWSHAHFDPQDSFSRAHEKKARRRRNRLAERSLRIEPFEERKLFAVSPILIAVIPNEGAVINNNDTVTVAPRELTIRFDEGQIIDPTTLGSITVTRSNFDDVFNANDVAVNVGYVGIGEKTNEVVIRFAENLPDDRYRVRIGAGLENTEGDAFNNGTATNVDFNLNLGAQVIAVVPQPVTRSGSTLTQATNQIEVYFNNDDLSTLAAQNPLFYELIRTQGTLSNLDDSIVNPISVVYDNAADKATLTFAAGVLETAGTFRLRIGNNDPLPLAPVNLTPLVTTDNNSSAATATNLGTLFTATAGNQSVQLSAEINRQSFGIVWPGGQDMPGHRQNLLGIENHVGVGAGDTVGGVPTLFYNFRTIYGVDPINGQNLLNQITPAQKQRTREVLALFSTYAGVQFVEAPENSSNVDFVVATGDLRAISPTTLPAPGGVAGLAGVSVSTLLPTAIMDIQESWGDSTFGGAWQQTAMHEIGHLLGLDHAYDLPQLTVMGGGETSDDPAIGNAEVVLPGDADIQHLQYLYRPDVKDIDTYSFSLNQAGTLSLETIAQRRTTSQSETLDSVISVFDANRNLIARNDNYFGKDSYLTLDLSAGTYYVAITAAGNTAFDLNQNDSGIGGRSQGAYDLRMSFEPTPSGGLVDATGVLLDGDADGKAGGEYNFWFKTQTSTTVPATNRVIWVDKLSPAAPGTADGTLARPFTNIALALATAQPGDIVRIVGNNINADGTIDLANALTYNLGQSIFDTDLTDGGSMEVPKGVTVMIDAGAIFRLRGTSIDIGTSDVGIDRSGGAVQVLGTPKTNVVFTSWHDQATGKDIDPLPTTPAPGDWGGLVFRQDSDLEQNGIFLNYVNHADIRYGGGQNASFDVFNPIHMIEARPTITHNRITLSADAAMSADPNSFEETVFGNATFTADYGRVGPDIYGNRTTNNSLNGLFVRIETLPNNNLKPLTVQARFDDTDIVHVVTDNILIQGDAGGAVQGTATIVPRISIADSSVIEGNSGLAVMQFVVALDAPATQPVTVVYTTASGTASSGIDFFAATGTVTFLPGQQNRTIFVSVSGDTTVEANEAFTVTLSNPTNATVLDGVANGTLVNDDAVGPLLSIVGSAGLEGRFAGVFSEQGNVQTFTVALSAPQVTPVTVVFSTADGTASGVNTDYVPTSGTLTFAPGELTKTISVEIVGDTVPEENETFSVALSQATGATIQTAQATATILNDDQRPTLTPRVSAQLAIDPGIVVKLGGARIETQPGAQFLAEGTAANPVIFTSTLDDRYGRGGTFDTSGDGTSSSPNQGDWAGLYFGPTSSASLDHVLITHAGGFSGIRGGSAEFNAVEIQQASVRIANSILENNADGEDAGADTGADTARDGHLTNGAATIFVRGAQPTLVNNIIRNGAGAAISINVNSLNAELKNDPGRSTGFIDRAGNFFTNVGPVFKNNLLDDNDINGLVVRGGTLTTQSIWDDADIVHVVQDVIDVPNLHVYGGLRLQSTVGQSLIVKLDGPNAGFTAGGTPLEIDDRIGGTLQIVGVAGAPVVLTSLADDTVGAGRKPDGSFQKDTNNDGNATTPAAGDWRSVRLDKYSNDRNVGIVNESEQGYPSTGDSNASRTTAQQLGSLAPDEKSGDDNLRLGFVVHGSLSQTYDNRSTLDPADDRLADVDVYRFDAKAGTEVWLDIDRTTHALDVVLELIDANGSVVARSNDSAAESAAADLVTFNSPLLVGSLNRVKVLQKDLFEGTDFYSTNPRDAGMRVVLPGNAGETKPYYVRVRANSTNLSNTFEGATSGVYELQVRLREVDEFAGSTVRYADIRYATNGIEVLGKPENSPLLGESAEVGAHGDFDSAQDLGNLLAVNRNTLAVSGAIANEAQVDWYRFEVDYQSIQGAGGSFWPTIFDLDYADGMGRVNASLAVFNSAGTLIYWSKGGGTPDDRPRPLNGTDTADLSRGSFGSQDPYIGSVDLAEGNGRTYYVAVSSNAYIPLELNQFASASADNPLIRLEPVLEYNRIFTNRVNGASGTQDVGLNADEFHLGDVVLYVSTSAGLGTIDPFTGAIETVLTENGLPGLPNINYGDVVMRNDGRLYMFTRGDSDGNSGNFREISTGDASLVSSIDDGLVTSQLNPDSPFNADGTPNFVVQNVGVQFSAYTFIQSGTTRRLFAVGSRAPGLGVTTTTNLLYELNPNTGAPIDTWDNFADPQNTMLTNGVAAFLPTAPTITVPTATDLLNPLDLPGDILDGQTLVVTGPGGTVTLEFNTGPTAILADADHNNLFDTPVVDGETFTVNGVVFEFDQGIFLTAGAGGLFADGQTFTVTDSNLNTVTFEFDLNNTFTAGNQQIVFNLADTATIMAQRITAAINGAGLSTVATQIGSRITLVNDVDVNVTLSPGLAKSGQGVTAGNVAVPYEESQSVSVVGNRIAQVISANAANVTASFARDRLTIYGGTFTENSVVMTPGPGDNAIGAGNVEIVVNAADSANAIATRITDAINAAAIGVTATNQGGSIEVLSSTSITPSGPITVRGEGRGGVITGLAAVDGTLYAVTSAGDLFSITAPGSAGATPVLIANLDDPLGDPISFTGLSTGPQNVEDGFYSDMLFATDADGNVWAFDTTGAFQPIFLDGEISISTGVVGLTGLAFSTLDYNLWHITSGRGGDAGHTGGTASSYYFGLDNPQTSAEVQPGADAYGTNNGVYGTYNLPGGAYGSLTTDPIDLTGYTAADLPTLYFTYFYEAEANTQFDTVRVFASADGAEWTLIGQPFRNTNSWRQAKIDLSAFAGESDVRVRFDFSTAGDMHVGTNLYTGEIMRALAANRLRDGDTFEIDGVTFEFDLGATLVTQSGPLTLDGDTILINGTTFEFDNDGSVLGGNVAVGFMDGDSIGDIAFKLSQTINDQGIGVTALLDEGITITTQDGDDILDGDTVTVGTVTYEFDLDGSFNFANSPIFVTVADTAEEVAENLALAIEFDGGNPVVTGNTIRLEDTRTAGVTGLSASVVANSARINLQGATTATVTGTSVTVDGEVGVELGNVAVPIDTTMDDADVAQAIGVVMDAEFVVGIGNTDDPNVLQSVKVDGSQLHLIGHSVTDFNGILPFSQILPGDHPPGPLDGDRFLSVARGQNNAFNGIYLDDFIVGFASRGEQVLFAGGEVDYQEDPARPNPDPNIVVGNYDLEIRRGRTPELPLFPPTPTPYPIASNVPDPVGRVDEDGEVPIPTDVRDRLGSLLTLIVSQVTSITEGETFRLSDGVRTAIFEFDSNGSVGQTVLSDGSTVLHQPIAFISTSTLIELNAAIVAAINDRSATSKLPAGFLVQAAVGNTGNRIDLFDVISVDTSPTVSFQLAIDAAPPIQVDSSTDLRSLYGAPVTRGAQNAHREQGYTLIQNNTISDSLEFGIVVDSTARDELNQPHPGAVRNLRELNANRLVPGIALVNNLIVAGGDGGIHFSGDAGAAGALAAAPFGRIVNNTIYGGPTANGVGILVDDGASPTILNNILANNVTGIQVTNGAGTELGLNLYQGNTTPVTGASEPSLAGVTNFLNPADPLFVDAASRNFYLKTGSKAIDSSDNSVDERASLHTVIADLGIPDSPILAPSLDLLGQLRVDDSTVSSPPGLGAQVFKDRGAIERADFTGSTVALVNPLDNDAAGLDKNTATTQVQLVGQRVTNFSFQFSDGTGVGIADSTVTQANITFRRNGTVVAATDYLFSYDSTSNTVRLQAAQGFFVDGTYTIEINNSATGVRDIADNPIKPNQASGVNAGKTLFTIEISATSAAPWQNPNNALDVNASGLVTPLDAAILIDYMNRFGIGALPLPASPPPYYDINGDGNVTPGDLVLVITYLNQQAAGLLSSYETSDMAPLALIAGDPIDTTTVSTYQSASIETSSSDIAVGLSSASVGKSTVGGAAVSSALSATVSPETRVSLDDVWASVGDDSDLLLEDVLGDLAGETSDSTSDDDALFDEIDALLI